MATMKWTKGQSNAISARRGSVLVSAAAGSGKTAVLVQRVIETITSKVNPVPIDRMLIVTFTRAAREEMLTRVEKAINKLLKDDPYNKHLLMQRQLLYNAKITTIDGFCTDFVRQYFHKLDIQQDFRIADEKELILLKNQALDNTLEYFYNENSAEFNGLVEALCTYKSDNRLRDYILKLYTFLVTIPFMESWMDSKLEYYNTEITPVESSPFVSYILSKLSACIEYCLELNSNALKMVENDELMKEKVRTKIYDVLNLDKAQLEELLQKAKDSDWEEVYSICSSLKLKDYPRDKDESGVKNSIKAIRDIYRKELDKGCKPLSGTLEDIEKDANKLYFIIKTFFTCVKRFNEEFTQLKREKNVLDFPDIENNMIKLLCTEVDGKLEYTETAKEISSMFDCIMVDEFQDINEVQNLIFKAVSKDEGNLFMVGDVKQSIYGFRQANPEIFTSYKEKYPLYNEEEDTYPGKIILDKNFRSRDSVLDACNFVFKKLMSPEVGGIEYNEEEVLNCGANYIPYDKAKTEFMIINTAKADEDNDDTKTIIEARNVADKINKILYEEKYMVQDNGSMRPVQPGDIAILLRTSKGMARKAALYVEILAQQGIIATALEKKSIFDSMEIKILMNMLRVIDNPLRDIPLLSVLISPMCGFTPDDMAEIRCDYPKEPLYTAIVKSQEKNPKCKDFVTLLTDLRTASVTSSVDMLIGIIMQMTGFDCIMMSVNGDTGNILLLQKYAREYSDNGYVSLTSFISFMDKIIESGQSLDGSVNNEGDSLNAVRVMSIHGSKGLEFPVCFICDTGTQFNVKDAGEDMIIDAKSGVGFRYKNDFIKYDTIQRKAVSMMLIDSFISEEIRILYVAMTRAKERLIITAGNKDPEKYISTIASKLTGENLTPFAVSNFSSFSDWITACALLHPSGEIWRKKYGCPVEIPRIDCEFPWVMSVVDDSEVDQFASKKTSVIGEVIPVSLSFLDSFTAKINHHYQYEFLTSLPQKVSASELAHKDTGVFDKILRKPEFLEDKKVSSTEVGTAVHKFIEKCDFTLAKENLDEEILRLVQNGYLTETQSNIIDRDKIQRFLESDFIERVQKSSQVYREFRFTVKINSNDFDLSIPAEFAEEKIIMQGAVDLVFVEDNQLVIVDYKTDRVKDINSLKEIYSKQLQLYKTAMEQSLELPVKEMYIYSLYLNEKLNIPT